MTDTHFGDERRGFPRRRLARPVKLRSPVGAFAHATGLINDVSASGVYLMVPFSVESGTTLELVFDMPTLVGDRSYPVLCTATVVRVAAVADNQFGVAAAFQRIDIIGEA